MEMCDNVDLRKLEDMFDRVASTFGVILAKLYLFAVLNISVLDCFGCYTRFSVLATTANRNPLEPKEVL